MNTKVYKSSDENAVDEAVASIKYGNLAIIPTDTVYGVAAYPEIGAAIEKIYEAKARDGKKPIAFLASDIDVIERLANISEESIQLADKHWPGALTLILQMKSGGYEGFRIPDHNLAREIIRQCGGLLKVTSANLSGEPDTCTAESAIAAIGDYADICIDDGKSPGGIASTVIKDDPEKGLTILRQGSVKI
ncbi:MAG: L-threonylcarbamoyladenylate synthase [Kiritimatiellae bacterium]|jgi:L-threonylcarbamoyladenylate synthase|nr:L-threonylcarbamoyladenylate synthase [Kiritimatiellia bacterium]